MFEGLTEKGFKELEKHEIEFHYKLALKTLMRVNFFFFFKVDKICNFYQKTQKKRNEVKRNASRSSSKSHKSKRKNSKYKGKLEFHAANPLYTYLICVTCLRSWKKFSENTELLPEIEEKEAKIRQIIEKKRESKRIESPALVSAKLPEKSMDNMEFVMNSYLVVPNYILDNQ